MVRYRASLAGSEGPGPPRPPGDPPIRTSHRSLVFAAGLAALAAGGPSALGCASNVGDSYVWKRPCGTPEQLRADRQACLGESAGVADPSGSAGLEYTTEIFRDCMERRGWQRVSPDTVMRCE